MEEAGLPSVASLRKPAIASRCCCSARSRSLADLLRHMNLSPRTVAGWMAADGAGRGGHLAPATVSEKLRDEVLHNSFAIVMPIHQIRQKTHKREKRKKRGGGSKSRIVTQVSSFDFVSASQETHEHTSERPPRAVSIHRSCTRHRQRQDSVESCRQQTLRHMRRQASSLSHPAPNAPELYI